MQRFGMKFIIGMILLCGISGILAGFADHSAPKLDSELMEEDMGEQLELLYSLGENLVDSPVQLTLKLQGESSSHSISTKKEETVEALAHKIGLTEISYEDKKAQQAYRARDIISGIHVRMDWVEAGGRSYAKVQLEIEDSVKFHKLLDIQKKTVSFLKELGMNPTWNASVQGLVYKGLSVGDTIQSIEREITPHLLLNSVESYQDAGTESISYEVPSLKNYVMSGGKPIHMQVAVHEDSMNKNNRITIGFPVITIEY